MPYYNKLLGIMSDVPWDSHAMEVVTIQQLAEHRAISLHYFPQNCLRCVTALSLEEALTIYLKGAA